MQRLWRLVVKSRVAFLIAIGVVIITSGAVVYALHAQTAPAAAQRTQAATATPSPTATATATPTVTPFPTAAVTLQPHPIATPLPSGPNSPGNWLAVSVDYSYAGCHFGNGALRAYPLLYLTNTNPDVRNFLFWGAQNLSASQFSLRGDEGAEIDGGHTETARFLPEFPPPGPAISVEILTFPYPTSILPGHWQGTVQPCH
jgi:hypothetical protein